MLFLFLAILSIIVLVLFAFFSSDKIKLKFKIILFVLLSVIAIFYISNILVYTNIAEKYGEYIGTSEINGGYYAVSGLRECSPTVHDNEDECYINIFLKQAM